MTESGAARVLAAPPPREEFDLIELPDGAVLLEAPTGNWFWLNRSAAQIWSQYLAGRTPEEIVHDLARLYGLAPSAALMADVQTSLQLATDFVPPKPFNLFDYVVQPGGYEVRHDDARLFVVRDDGHSIELIDRTLSADRLYWYLLGIAPKIAALLGTLVLHASAVIARDKAILFLGDSGAGKTTTARAFASAGAELVAEDKVVMVLASDGSPVACNQGEANILRWARQTATLASETGRATCHSLLEITKGARTPVEELFLLDVSRRTDVTAIHGRRLEPAEACCRVLPSIFIGSRKRASWARQVAEVARLVSAPTTVYEAHVPSDLATLAGAAVERLRGRVG